MTSYIVAITGASGSIYGIRLIDALLKLDHKVHLCISTTAFSIIKDETGIDWSAEETHLIQEKIRSYFSSGNINFYHESDLFAPISSGSFRTSGMFIVPCSMKTMSAISHGYAANLIERAADVILKEGRKLLISPREMPFNTIHIENMLRLSKMGVIVAPPVPAFYHSPKDINDIVDFVVGKLLDSMGIENSLFKRWKKENNQS
jgi:4-hydroxy-3-polyprenylbenzoate decarboxylase